MEKEILLDRDVVEEGTQANEGELHMPDEAAASSGTEQRERAALLASEDPRAREEHATEHQLEAALADPGIHAARFHQADL